MHTILSRLTLAALLLMSSVLSAHSAETLTRAQMREKALALRTLCAADARAFCNTVTPGGGRILLCLRNNQNQISQPCAAALGDAEALKQAALAAGVMPN